MKVVEILKHSAELLGLDKTKTLLDTVNEENKAEISVDDDVAKLLSLAKFAVQELCTNYCPLLDKYEFSTTDKKFALNRLKNYIRIVDVKKDGVSCAYKIYNRDITLEEDGKYIVEYMSFKTIETLLDEIDFLSQFSPDVLVFAICAYYSVAHGMFDQFEEFHDLYIDKAESLKELRSGQMPMRKWE